MNRVSLFSSQMKFPTRQSHSGIYLSLRYCIVFSHIQPYIRNVNESANDTNDRLIINTVAYYQNIFVAKECTALLLSNDKLSLVRISTITGNLRIHWYFIVFANIGKCSQKKSLLLYDEGFHIAFQKRMSGIVWFIINRSERYTNEKKHIFP